MRVRGPASTASADPKQRINHDGDDHQCRIKDRNAFVHDQSVEQCSELGSQSQGRLTRFERNLSQAFGSDWPEAERHLFQFLAAFSMVGYVHDVHGVQGPEKRDGQKGKQELQYRVDRDLIETGCNCRSDPDRHAPSFNGGARLMVSINTRIHVRQLIFCIRIKMGSLIFRRRFCVHDSELIQAA